MWELRKSFPHNTPKSAISSQLLFQLFRELSEKAQILKKIPSWSTETVLELQNIQLFFHRFFLAFSVSNYAEEQVNFCYSSAPASILKQFLSTNLTKHISYGCMDQKKHQNAPYDVFALFMHANVTTENKPKGATDIFILSHKFYNMKAKSSSQMERLFTQYLPIEFTPAAAIRTRF